MAFPQIYCGFCLASVVDFCVEAIYALILLYVIAFFFSIILIAVKIKMYK